MDYGLQFGSRQLWFTSHDPSQTVTDITTETKFITLFHLMTSNSSYIVFHILIPQGLREQFLFT